PIPRSWTTKHPTPSCPRQSAKSLAICPTPNGFSSALISSPPNDRRFQTKERQSTSAAEGASQQQDRNCPAQRRWKQDGRQPDGRSGRNTECNTRRTDRRLGNSG